MRTVTIGVLAMALLGVCWSGNRVQPENDASALAVQKGVRWLAAVQGKDGGWGQDGGETSFVRTGERLETNGNDVANTAVAVQALLHAGNSPTQGPYAAAVRRGVDFILRQVEQCPDEGLAVTSVTGTQIQRKLGPYIDTFLTSMLLAEIDGNMGDARSNQRVRAALQKCVNKVEKNQQKDGSWNIAGGWAPILGTSMASRSLYVAGQKGVKVKPEIAAKVDEYTKQNSRTNGPAAAGVPLYQRAQALEQLSRTSADRAKNEADIKSITRELASPRVVNGFGSMGGEEFFSYLNISDSLHRGGGEEWNQWNQQIKTRLVTLQNDDGTWAGHHCITGRVAVTSAAVLTLRGERDPIMQQARK